jgi:hypothetical protein
MKVIISIYKAFLYLELKKQIYMVAIKDSQIHMVQELSEIEKLIFGTNGLKVFNVTKDKECCDYLGYNFQIGNQQIKFRKAKLTPKKIGQFVTLWKRNLIGQTVPFDMDDDFDFYIIMASNAHQAGFFLFPKEILARMGIVSAYEREGKRGFRIYPEWDVPVSSQGLRTKRWQAEYFIELNNEKKTIEKLQRIFTVKYFC